MAVVYEGFDERLSRPVAVKMLRADVAAGHPEVRARFESEARSAAGLSHPNVVAVFDTGEDDGVAFIVMERLPGQTLAQLMAEGPVDLEWLRRVAGDVLGALGAAHAAGIVHRDIKPGNVLIAENGCAKVADFGIAKSLEAAGPDLTGTNLLVGTPAYMAPERVVGEPATVQADLYSLGVVLYEAASGRKPFTGATPVALAYAIRHGEVEPLRNLRPEVDPTMAAVVAQAMSADPAARFASAAAMATALGVGAGDATVPMAAGPVDATMTMPVGAAAAPAASFWAGRRLRLVAVGAVALVVVLAALAAASGGKTGAKAETSTTVTTAAPAKPVVSSAPRSTSPTTAGLRVQVRVPQLPHKGHDKGGGGKGD
ncbi:MAG: eukaryotic-like serine/threonine-protein kinase [Actinomycetota bacterium]|jgi:serine/threonine protein kinase|nr:eukaryotic-like serine/threonine-protein kinase [Actinomycetota bacterium]